MTDATASCPQCERLRAQLRELRQERDAALLSLAEERARANAILISQIAFPAPAEPPKPARYWVVDVLNSGMKRALPLPHAGARAAIEPLRRFRKDQP